MPRMTNILLTSALSLSALFAASAATAEETVVHIYEKGYYPMVVYFNSGDSLRYVNETPYTVRLELISGADLVTSLAPGDDVVLFPDASTTYTLDEPFLINLGGRYNTGINHIIQPGTPPLS